MSTLISISSLFLDEKEDTLEAIRDSKGTQIENLNVMCSFTVSSASHSEFHFDQLSQLERIASF